MRLFCQTMEQLPLTYQYIHLVINHNVNSQKVDNPTGPQGSLEGGSQGLTLKQHPPARDPLASLLQLTCCTHPCPPPGWFRLSKHGERRLYRTPNFIFYETYQVGSDCDNAPVLTILILCDNSIEISSFR